jgi:hypothetical protein
VCAEWLLLRLGAAHSLNTVRVRLMAPSEHSARVYGAASDARERTARGFTFPSIKRAPHVAAMGVCMCVRSTLANCLSKSLFPTETATGFLCAL